MVLFTNYQGVVVIERRKDDFLGEGCDVNATLVTRMIM
jgi:hypothetical protein